jgi:hypothetical protein
LETALARPDDVREKSALPADMDFLPRAKPAVGR